jgi:HEAT repeat protein
MSTAVKVGSLTRAIRKLPLDAAAADRLLELARSQDPAVRRALERTLGALSGSVEQSAPPPRPDLDSLLRSDAGYRQKIDALLQAQQLRDPGAPPVVRKLIAGETHPFVVATMASTLGRLGDRSLDGPLLMAFLDHADARVVANTIEALDVLRVPVPAAMLESLLERSDDRLRANALALIGKSDPQRVLELMPAFLTQSAPTLRSRAAFILGEIEDERAAELLMDLLAREPEPQVLRQVGEGLRKHIAPSTAIAMIGRLVNLREELPAQGALLADIVLKEAAVQMGLVAAQVQEIGVRWAAEQRARAATATDVEEEDDDGDADLPCSFSAVWGKRPTRKIPKKPATPAAISVPVEAPRPSTVPWWSGIGVALAVMGALVAWPASDARAGLVTAKPAAAAPRAAASAAPSPAAQRPVARPLAGGSYTRRDTAAAPDVPAIGTSVDLEGELVMKAGAFPVMRANGRYWLLRGPLTPSLPMGKPIKVSGVVGGIGPNGLVYLDVTGS